MLETKTFEIRDKGTFIPVMATAMRKWIGHESQDEYLIRRAGYGPGHLLVMLCKLGGEEISYTPEHWLDKYWRTMTAAHTHIQENWDTLSSGQVIDIEFIIGETDKPKVSERYATD